MAQASTVSLPTYYSWITVREVLHAIQQIGIAPEEIFARLGAEHPLPRIVRSGEGRLDGADMEALWRDLERLTGRRGIGLVLGGVERPLLHQLSTMAAFAPTLGEAMQRLAAYWPAFYYNSTLRVEDHFTHWEVRYVPRPHLSMFHHMVEFRMASLLRLFEWITGREIAPRFAHFNLPTPEHIKEYYRVFRSPCLFRQGEYLLVLDAADCRLPLLDAEPGMDAVMQQHGGQWMEARLQNPTHLRQIVERALFDSIRDGDWSLPAAARNLGMAPRTLQRRLDDAGLGFRTLVDGARHHLAHYWLLKTEMPLEEISGHLGYGHVENFIRAFRRWGGETPARLRRQVARAGGKSA